MVVVDCENPGRTKGNWYTAVSPLCGCRTHMGPADYFGRTRIENLPENVPLLTGETVHADQQGICAGFNQIMATLPQTLSNSVVISSVGCADGPDNLHFSAACYRELGKRYAVKMLQLMGVKSE